LYFLLCILLFVIIAASTKINSDNWTTVNGSFVPYGVRSIFSGAGQIFFAYLGFDMVSSMASETKKPQRDIPIGIIGSLGIATIIYTLVTLTVTGLIPFTEIVYKPAPIALAFQIKDMNWAAKIISFGSIFALTTATFTSLWGQPRIFLSIARDGLLFKFFTYIWPRTQIPLMGTILTGCFSALISFFTPLEILAEAVSVGTLLSFTIVNTGMIIVRYNPQYQLTKSTAKIYGTIILYLIISFLFAASYTYYWPLPVVIVLGCIIIILIIYLWKQEQKNIPTTTFKCPLVPLVPCMAILVNAVIILGLSFASFIRFIVWLLVGLIIYFSYGIHHSRLNNNKTE